MFETAYETTTDAAITGPRPASGAAGARQVETDWAALAEKVGPGSLLGRTMADWRSLLFLPMALGIQNGHREVSLLTVVHGTVFDHPWERAGETASFVFRFFFEDPVRAGRAVRELHREIDATDEDGRRVHAWYEPAWTFCALTTSWAFMAAGEWLNGGLTEDERAELFDGCMAFCRLAGVNERRLPADAAALDAYNKRFCDDEMERTPATIRLAELGQDIPAPPRVPMWAWRPVRGAVRHLGKLLTGGPAPVSARERCGMSWGRREDLQYKALLGLLRQVDRLPERMRLLPAARRAREAWLAEQSARVAALPRTTIV